MTVCAREIFSIDGQSTIRTWLVFVPMLELIISHSIALHINFAQHQLGTNGWLIATVMLIRSAKVAQQLDLPASALSILRNLPHACTDQRQA